MKTIKELTRLFSSPLAMKRLFWILLRRCMVCHEPLSQDWPQYDNGEHLYCMPCGGIIHPRGVVRAIRGHLLKKESEAKAV
jgi:hypothetical protein